MGKKAKRSTALTVFGVIVGTLLLSGGALALARSQEDTRTLSTFDWSVGLFEEGTGKLPEASEGEDEAKIDKTGMHTDEYFTLSGAKVTLAEDANLTYRMNVYDKNKNFVSATEHTGDFNAEYLTKIDFEDGFSVYEYCKENAVKFGEGFSDIELSRGINGLYGMKGTIDTALGFNIILNGAYLEQVFSYTNATELRLSLIPWDNIDCIQYMIEGDIDYVETSTSEDGIFILKVSKAKYLSYREKIGNGDMILYVCLSNSGQYFSIDDICAMNGDETAKINKDLLVRFEVMPTAKETTNEETGEVTVEELQDLNFFTKTELASKITIEVAKD